MALKKDVIETEIRVANKAQKDIAENEQQIRSLKDANRALKKGYGKRTGMSCQSGKGC
ncbi:MAG: hypothetical protein LBS79_05780 [Tannerella sp.]|jgi:hypothetical protein|nr:hypothetical protein [Tannerella sp.]